MEWRFREILPGEVEKDITQRDQFLNESSAIPDALIREAVQNSLDACFGNKTVGVSFTLRQLSPEAAKFTRDLFAPQLSHAEAAGLNVEEVSWDEHEVLLIEDYGTTGLTGATDEVDEQPFSDFWRRHGKSHKSGVNLGRHGLGKLVYSISSQLGAFFGITLRRGDNAPHLMGQSVLNTHSMNGKSFDSHGFFTDYLENGLQIPIEDESFMKEFCGHVSVDRSEEPGLSIVIPVPDSSLRDVDHLIETGIKNYFVPIVGDKLRLRFNEIEINSSTLREMVRIYARGKIPDADMLFDFLEHSFTTPVDNHFVAKDDWWQDSKLAENDFEPKDLEKMQEMFLAGDVVPVLLRVPIRKRGEKETVDSYVTVYVQRGVEISEGQDFYVRGGLTLPDESKFGHRKAFGALFANDKAVNSFLGDAENASHSKWNAQAQKFRNRYVYGPRIISALRNSIVKLHDLLADTADEEDTDALINLFWAPVQEKRRKPKPKPKPDVPPPQPPPPRPKPIRIDEQTDGFSIAPGDGIKDAELPIRGQLIAAYDVLGHNPFKFYSPFDFDVGNDNEIVKSAQNVNVTSATNNTLTFEITEREFNLRLSGFDTSRQVKVNVQTEA